MTVAADYDILTYEGNGVTKKFTIPFKFFDEEIAVYKDKTYETYEKDVDYTIVNNGNGGEITFTSAPESGHSVTIVRSVPLNQLVTFIEGEDFPAADYEYSLDRIVMALQEMWGDLKKVAIPPAAISVKDFIENYYTKTEADEKFATFATFNVAFTEAIRAQCYVRKNCHAVYMDWVLDENATTDFKYKNTCQVVGFDSSYSKGWYKSAIVTFDTETAISGNFAPTAELSEDENREYSVTIYAKEAPTENVVFTVTLIH